MTKQKPYGTVLIKADHILNFLASDNKPKRLTDIAKNTGLTQSTASKILTTLSLIGYVQKDPLTHVFKIGPAILKYANKGIEQIEIKQIAKPHLEALQQATTETVHLGMIEKSKIVYISKIESNHPVNLYSQIGKSIPLYCSAMGKSILAEQSDDKVDRYLSENKLIRKTAHTFTTKASFIKELANIKKQGYAFDDGEHEIDVFCIGASLILNGKVLGAISVSVPKYRIDEPKVNAIIAAIQTCQTNILADL